MGLDPHPGASEGQDGVDGRDGPQSRRPSLRALLVTGSSFPTQRSTTLTPTLGLPSYCDPCRSGLTSLLWRTCPRGRVSVFPLRH